MLRRGGGHVRDFKDRHHNLLQVSGEKIRLITFPAGNLSKEATQATRLENKPPQLIATLKTPATRKPPPTRKNTAHQKETNRDLYQLKVTNYTNGDVCSNNLKDIRGTVQVQDFKRLLQRYTRTTTNSGEGFEASHPIRCIDPNSVYEEFYGKYYKSLKKIAQQ